MRLYTSISMAVGRLAWRPAIFMIAFVTLGWTPPGTAHGFNESGGPRKLDGNDQNSTSTLTASFNDLEKSLAGRIGTAIMTSDGIRSFGSWATGPAWSTAKVPLALAALQRSPDQAAPFVAAAISDSDNVAAEELWTQLGDAEQAASAVAAVLKSGGDNGTVIQAHRTRPEFTAFGQTIWSLNAQATFAAALPCLKDATPVINYMHNVAINQQWGMATHGAAIKGGWGPSPSGNYLVRQMAIIDTRPGAIGIGMASEPSDGTFESGKQQLNRVAQWTITAIRQFSGKICEH